ncbi:MAG: energy transducer TonB [Candidimonas sp.]|nr:MAG: energy transducer TonB [Candidimonas sp.]
MQKVFRQSRCQTASRGFALACTVLLHAAAATLILAHLHRATPAPPGAPVLVSVVQLLPARQAPAKTAAPPVAQTEPEPAPPTPPEPEPPVREPPPKPEATARPKPVMRKRERPRIPRPARRAQPSASAGHTQKPVTPPVTAAASAPRTAATTTAPAVPTNEPRHVSTIAYLGSPPRPHYPPAALRRHQTGEVVVRVIISATGAVVNASVERSSGHSLLDDAALAAVRKARFRPHTENGVAYTAMADIPFNFVL